MISKLSIHFLPSTYRTMYGTRGSTSSTSSSPGDTIPAVKENNENDENQKRKLQHRWYFYDLPFRKSWSLHALQPILLSTCLSALNCNLPIGKACWQRNCTCGTVCILHRKGKLCTGFICVNTLLLTFNFSLNCFQHLKRLSIIWEIIYAELQHYTYVDVVVGKEKTESLFDASSAMQSIWASKNICNTWTRSAGNNKSTYRHDVNIKLDEITMIASKLYVMQTEQKSLYPQNLSQQQWNV